MPRIKLTIARDPLDYPPRGPDGMHTWTAGWKAGGRYWQVHPIHVDPDWTETETRTLIRSLLDPQVQARDW